MREAGYLREVFSAATVGLCILDNKGAILELNDAAEHILEISSLRAAGLQFGDAFQCENSLMAGCGHGAACKVCPVRHTIEGAAAQREFSKKFTAALHRSGAAGACWLEIFVSKTRQPEEQKIVLSLVDITDRKQREAALEQARKDAEAESAAKGQFLANMSHEIRTPINGMIGMIELTLRTELTQDQRENLESAKQCSEYLMQIINDILDFSKLENKAMQLEQTRFDLQELLQGVLFVHGKTAAGKGLYMQDMLDKSLPRYIRGDALRLRQILHNLLSNALKFTAEGGVVLQVEKAVRQNLPVLNFVVEDTGIGMQPEDTKKLFRPFSQVDGSMTRRFGGTGLGLMIVKELVEAMGGEVSVTSKPGMGSKFHFWIPCHEEHGADDEIHGHTVYINPQCGQPVRTGDNEDIADLLQYYTDKLKE